MIKELSEVFDTLPLTVAIEDLIDAADEFDKGCELTEQRIKAIADGAEVGEDDLDDIEMEKILAELKIRRCIKQIRGMVNGK